MRFSTVALGVAGLEASLRFYVEGLGFAVDSRPQEDLVYLASGSTRIALYPGPKLAEYAGFPQAGPGSVVLSLNVDSVSDVDTVFGRALAHGGRALRRPSPVEWGGYAATAADPDGHVWEIVKAGP